MYYVLVTFLKIKEIILLLKYGKKRFKRFKSNIIFVGLSDPQNYEVDIKIKQRIKNKQKN